MRVGLPDRPSLGGATADAARAVPWPAWGEREACPNTPHAGTAPGQACGRLGLGQPNACDPPAGRWRHPSPVGRLVWTGRALRKAQRGSRSFPSRTSVSGPLQLCSVQRDPRQPGEESVLATRVVIDDENEGKAAEARPALLPPSETD